MKEVYLSLLAQTSQMVVDGVLVFRLFHLLSRRPYIR
jgi:hypothetical protein